MTRKTNRLLLLGTSVFFVTVYWNLQSESLNRSNLLTNNGELLKTPAINISSNGSRESPIKIVLVSCQDRTNQTLVSIKSAILFSRSPLHFFIFADNENQRILLHRTAALPRKVQARVKFTILPTSFPDSNKEDEWKKLFRPCSSQRLFLTYLLPHEDSVLYLDTDTVFLSNVEQLWSYFSVMNSSHIAAAAPESEENRTGWYNRFAHIPYVAPYGINSGVMLLNLTRMRAFQWMNKVIPAYEKYSSHIVWGDQDIINIVFHNNTDKLFILPCHWNFRPDFCHYENTCKTANKQGPSLMHGNRAVFSNPKEPSFKAVYNTIDRFKLDERKSLKEAFISPLMISIFETVNTHCGRFMKSHMKQISRTVYDALHQDYDYD